MGVINIDTHYFMSKIENIELLVGLSKFSESLHRHTKFHWAYNSSATHIIASDASV
jgi:hypothetical protein